MNAIQKIQMDMLVINGLTSYLSAIIFMDWAVQSRTRDEAHGLLDAFMKQFTQGMRASPHPVDFITGSIDAAAEMVAVYHGSIDTAFDAVGK